MRNETNSDYINTIISQFIRIITVLVMMLIWAVQILYQDRCALYYVEYLYSYELDDNILFINKDNKTVDYLYVN